MRGKREEQLIKNTIIITIGKASTQMINFLLLPLYTALLSIEEYGTVDLVNTVTLLLVPVITFQIEQGLFRFLVENRNDDKRKADIISSTFASSLIQLIGFIAIFILVTQFIDNNYKIYLAFSVISYIFSSLLLQLVRGLGDNITYTVSSSLTSIMTVIGNVLFIAIFQMGASGMLLASIIAYSTGAIYIIYRINVYKYFSWRKIRWNTIESLWRYSIPLIPNAISWWVFNTSDRVIVNFVLGVGANGILAVTHKFSQVYIAVYNIFNIAWTESASLHINDDDAAEYFSRIINTCMKLFTSLCILIISVMPAFFPLMVNENYNDAYNYVPILMFASLGNVGVGVISVIYIALKDTKVVARTSGVAAIINCIVHIALISEIGLYAAVISTFVAYYVMFIYRWFDINKRMKLYFDTKFMTSAVFVSIFICMAYYYKNIVINVVSFIIAIVYSVLINGTSFQFVKEIVYKKFKKI